MKKLSFFLLLLWWHTSIVSAQSNFQPGYVVSANGDTLRGLLRRGGAELSGKQCVFRTNSETENITYLPSQLQGYGFVKGPVYQSHQLKPTAEPVFLRSLVMGRLSLYAHLRDGKETFYAKKRDELLQTLIQTDTIIQIQTAGIGQLVSKRDYKYRNVLWVLMKDCPSAQANVKELAYTENKLQDAIRRYNGCFASEEKYVAPLPSSRKKMMFVAGVRTEIMKDLGLGERKLKSSMQPMLGIGLQIEPAKFKYRLSVLAHALITRQKFSDSYETESMLGGSSQIVVLQSDIRITSLFLPLALRYTTSQAAVRIFIEAGAVPTLNVQSHASLVYTFSHNQGAPSIYSEDIPIRDYNFGAFAGGGVTISCGKVGTLHLGVRKDFMDAHGAGLYRFAKPAGTSILAGFTIGQ